MEFDKITCLKNLEKIVFANTLWKSPSRAYYKARENLNPALSIPYPEMTLLFVNFPGRTYIAEAERLYQRIHKK